MDAATPARAPVEILLDRAQVIAWEGETVGGVARRLGRPVPGLCDVEGLPPLQSCYVCLVEVEGEARLRPACVEPVRQGLVVVTDSEAAELARRTAVELLLSDHMGECEAPCERACPAGWDIEPFMEALSSGDRAGALALAQDGLALPATLGYACHAACHKACRRAEEDESLDIKGLHRIVAEEDLLGEAPRIPPVRPFTGKRVVVVGAGPAGLAAAYRLRQGGHGCTVLDAAPRGGGSLREVEGLPARVLDAEIGTLERMGVQLRLGVRVGEHITLDELRASWDAVLLTTASEPAEAITRGAEGAAGTALAGLGGKKAANVHTRATRLPGVFAAGHAAGRGKILIRTIGDGLAAAASIDQHLRGLPVVGPGRPFVVRYWDLEEEERELIAERARLDLDQQLPLEGLRDAEEEAARCLLCGCRETALCGLRGLSGQVGARQGHFSGERRPLVRDESHALITYESGKCILCSACVLAAEREGADPGIAIVGRGFAARVAGPFGDPLAIALDDRSALAAAAVCPTRALRLKSQAECGAAYLVGSSQEGGGVR